MDNLDLDTQKNNHRWSPAVCYCLQSTKIDWLSSNVENKQIANDARQLERCVDLIWHICVTFAFELWRKTTDNDFRDCPTRLGDYDW